MAASSTPQALFEDKKLAETDRQLILRAYRGLMRDCSSFTNKAQRKQIREAFEYAHRAHENAVRKSGEPYILHPVAVARILVREMGIEDSVSVICALLHDVVEDTFAEVEDLEQVFGKTVGQIVDGLTKISTIKQDNLAGPAAGDISKQAENYKKMLLTMANDVRVALIKLADRLHNMRTLEHMKRHSQLKIAAETREVYAPLAHRLGIYTVKSELEDLALRYTEPEVYNQLEKKLKANRTQRDRYIQEFIRPVRRLLETEGLQAHIKGRVKTIHSIYDKILRQGKSLTEVDNIFDQVYDIFAIRIVLETPLEQEKADIFRTYALLTSVYRSHPERIRDWITSPKANGYESLHVTVMGPRGRWVEVQIRSERMDYAAEKGLAAHWRYKTRDPKTQAQDQVMESWLADVRALIETRQLTGKDFVSELKSDLVSEDIYVFSPKGQLYSLPLGSTALDFAYAIHTNIGNTAIGAKVNQKVAPLKHPLQNADQVEVLTSSNQQPEPQWLDFAATPKAISAIKDHLKLQRKSAIEQGRKFFDRKIEQLGLAAEHELVDDLLNELNLNSREEFFLRLGLHQVDIGRVQQFIRQKRNEIETGRNWRNSPPTETPASQLSTAEPATGTSNGATNGHVKSAPSGKKKAEATPELSQGKDDQELILSGTEHLSPEGYIRYRYATCCNPIYGDEIVAFAESDTKTGDTQGYVIHRHTCRRAQELLSSSSQRMVRARWNAGQNVEFLTGFQIRGKDQMGILNRIVRVVSLVMKKNMRSLTIDTHDGLFTGSIYLYVHAKDEMEKLLELLRALDGVISVHRIEHRSST